ncbi:MAG: prepilin-type N-terminal cleavage/methylation domain-containing protein [Tissierellales bacterium]|nr:prepilin-type N-terminal cleavage/methylation domain-containing protein [Tissierellales bacterium]
MIAIETTKSNKNKTGLTLIELVLALAIGSLVMVVGYALLFTGEKQFDVGQKKVIIDSELNQIAFALAEELKNSTIISNAYGENYIKLSSNNLEIWRVDSSTKLNESIEIKSASIDLDSTAAGEIINYTIVGEYKGAESKLSSSVLLNNIEDSRLEGDGNFELDSEILYYSKNYDVPKTYFMSGAKTEETKAFKAGILGAQVAMYYDGYHNFAYKSGGSHATFSSFERDIVDFFQEGTNSAAHKAELEAYITDPDSIDYINFSKGYVYFVSTYDSYEYHKMGERDADDGSAYEPPYDNSDLQDS